MSGIETAGAVAERLLDDQTLHDYLSVARANLRSARARARGEGPAALGDRRLQRQLAAAAQALRGAIARATGSPEPEPQRVGGLGSVVLLGVGVALLAEGLRARGAAA
jgi:hypothetical protein